MQKQKDPPDPLKIQENHEMAIVGMHIGATIRRAHIRAMQPGRPCSHRMGMRGGPRGVPAPLSPLRAKELNKGLPLSQEFATVLCCG